MIRLFIDQVLLSMSCRVPCATLVSQSPIGHPCMRAAIACRPCRRSPLAQPGGMRSIRALQPRRCPAAVLCRSAIRSTVLQPVSPSLIFGRKLRSTPELCQSDPSSHHRVAGLRCGLIAEARTSGYASRQLEARECVFQLSCALCWQVGAGAGAG